MALDLRLIRYAQALATHGNFSRAADALNISQPSLSRGIKDLESQVGLELFTRARHGVEPTDFGHIFLTQSALVVAQHADLEREVDLAKGLHRGGIAVGFGPYAAECLVPGCLRAFSAAHPGISVRIEVDALEALGRNLRMRSTELIIGEGSLFEEDESVETIARLSPVKAFMFVRRGHPLATATHPTMTDVLGYPYVQIARLPPRVFKHFLASRQRGAKSSSSLPNFPAFECPTVQFGTNAMIDSDAVMMATLSMMRGVLEARQVIPLLHEPWMKSDWAIMRLRGRTLTPAAQAFVAEVSRAHAHVVAEEAALQKRWTKKLLGALAGSGKAR